MSSQAVAWAITMKCETAATKAVLLSLANFANEYGECWQGQKTVAEGASLKPRQLRTLLKALEASGLIERTRRGNEKGGRDTDMIRLRMVEIPAIITAKRRPKPEQEQPAKSAAKEVSGKDCHGGLAAISEGVSGNIEGGKRQTIAGEIYIPISQDPNSVGAAKRTPTNKGSRLPDNWTLTPELVAYCAAKGYSEAHARVIAERFENYWRAATGRNATKLDWTRTFQNWVLNEKRWLIDQAVASQQSAGGNQPSDEERADILDRILRKGKYANG